MGGWFVMRSLLLGPRCESTSLDHLFCIFLPLVFLVIIFAGAHGLAEPHVPMILKAYILATRTPAPSLHSHHSDNHLDPQRECDTKHILHAWILPHTYVYITLHIPLYLSSVTLAVVSHP